ncbi:acyl-CoA dehydrogenase family protein [Massilia sp. PWRC2]|uniref:acyl-CoA dehydrogenase family protein n=1 Tax=Massilia sp. PWRC2 TaxID=2804626 RepID=UPI003CF9917A
MDFNLKEEQQQFAEALRRWIDKDYSFETRRQIIASPGGVSAAAWNTLAELGMTALPVPEQHGGFSGSAVDLYVVMKELGRALVVEPYFATVLGAQFLRRGGGHGNLLEQVAAGELKLACALHERQGRHELADIVTRARVDGSGFVLDGRKSVVVHGAEAGALIVSARVSGSQREHAGIALLVVAADAAGVTINGYRSLDGQRAADIVFDGVKLDGSAVIGVAGAGWDILDACADYGAALLCAEALGAMEALFDATLDYLKTRQQFGAPIGKFQALQHRMADMFIHLEQARSMALLAAVKADAADADERRRAVSAAKYRIGEAARFIGQQAVQLHGGMGVTNELIAAHHFKRLAMIELTLGDGDHHLRRFMAQPGFGGSAVQDAHA